MKKITVWAFENKKDKGRYLSDGPEFADYEHDRGDVLDPVDALLVWMADESEVTDEALEGFEENMKKMKFFDWQNEMRPHYNAVKIEVEKSVLDEIDSR